MKINGRYYTNSRGLSTMLGVGRNKLYAFLRAHHIIDKYNKPKAPGWDMIEYRGPSGTVATYFSYEDVERVKRLVFSGDVVLSPKDQQRWIEVRMSTGPIKDVRYLKEHEPSDSLKQYMGRRDHTMAVRSHELCKQLTRHNTEMVVSATMRQYKIEDRGVVSKVLYGTPEERLSVPMTDNTRKLIKDRTRLGLGKFTSHGVV